MTRAFFLIAALSGFGATACNAQPRTRACAPLSSDHSWPNSGVKFSGPGIVLDAPRALGIELLDVGSAPRRLLRYHFEGGQSGSVRSRWSIGQRDTNSGESTGMTAQLYEQLRIVSVSNDGSATFEFELSSGMLNSKAPKTKATPLSLPRVRGTGVFDARGGLHALQGSGTEHSIEPGFFSFLFSNCLGDQLPLEPVGVGARWRSRASANWFVTLRSISGDRVRLEYSGGVNLEHQPLRLGRASYGIGTAVPPTSANGFGEVVIDLSGVAATSLDLTLEQHFDFFTSSEPSKVSTVDVVFNDRCEVFNAPRE